MQYGFTAVTGNTRHLSSRGEVTHPVTFLMSLPSPKVMSGKETKSRRSILRASGGILAVALAGCTDSSDSGSSMTTAEQTRGSSEKSRTSSTSTEEPAETTTSATSEPGATRWQFDTGADRRLEPVAGDGSVFVSSSQEVIAVDTASGETQWKKQLPGSNVPRPVDGVLYVPTGNGVVAFDVEGDEPSELWRYNSEGDHPFRQPTVTADSVISMRWSNFSTGGTVVCLDRTDGTARWTKDIGDTTGRLLGADTNGVYVGGHRVYALNASDGSIQWRFEHENPQSWGAVVDPDRLFVYTGSNMSGGTIHALNRADGEELWADSLENPPAIPLADNDHVYVGGVGLRAYEKQDGTKTWSSNELTHAFPALGDSLLYAVGREGNLHAFGTESGKRQWTADTEALFAGTPAVGSGTVYAATDSGMLYAVQAGAQN